MKTLTTTICIILFLTFAPELFAQSSFGEQSLRPYVHVFVAYAIVWLLIFGWIFSIGRRLTRLEERIDR